MRMHKYQAWYEGKMYTVRTMRFEDTGTSLVYLEREGERSITCDDIAHMQLREFIGISDKHQKEIYEGDYLRLKLGNDVLEVRWSVFGFRFFNIKRNDWHMMWAADLKRLEVIGNIYEMPVLEEAVS